MPVPSDFIQQVLRNPAIVANQQARANVVMSEAQRLANSDLKRSPTPLGGRHYHDSFVTVPPFVRGNTLVSQIGNDSDVATIIEHGTKPHVIRARNATVLAFFWERKNTQFFGPQVNHPGTAAYLILARALSLSLQQFGS